VEGAFSELRSEGVLRSSSHGPAHLLVPSRCCKMYTMSLRTYGLQRRASITSQAKSDGLRLLRAIDSTQAHGQEGARVDPTRAAHDAGLDAGDVGSDRYHRALEYLVAEGALLGDEHTATQTGDRQAHGYALYFFTRRAVKLLEG
jgi:hypothetical protein